MSCIVCNSNNLELMFKGISDLEYETYKPVDYFICKDCGTLMQNPLPNPQILPSFYPGEYRNYLPVQNGFFSVLKNFQSQANASKIIRKKDKNLKILEIGFGNGSFLLALKQRGYKNLYGIDFESKTISSLKDQGINVQIANVEEEIPFDERFDLIIMNNVIEHFLDPIKVLRNCKAKLSSSGEIIFITPNTDALELLIFKKYWAGFHSPRHTFLFKRNSVKMLCKNLGLSLVKTQSVSDPAQWAISIQNVFQSIQFTRTRLKNGMAWYTLPLSLIIFPVVLLQNIIGKSTSLMYVVSNKQD